MMHQQGYGLPAYRGIVMQRGYGLGGFFKGLVRAVAPHVKQGLKKVGKKALKTGLQVISDVSEGQNLKQSLKRRCLLYTSPSPRDGLLSRMPSSA